jgi:hypothetical protein
MSYKLILILFLLQEEISKIIINVTNNSSNNYYNCYFLIYIRLLVSRGVNTTDGSLDLISRFFSASGSSLSFCSHFTASAICVLGSGTRSKKKNLDSNFLETNFCCVQKIVWSFISAPMLTPPQRYVLAPMCSLVILIQPLPRSTSFTNNNTNIYQRVYF